MAGKKLILAILHFEIHISALFLNPPFFLYLVFLTFHLIFQSKIWHCIAKGINCHWKRYLTNVIAAAAAILFGDIIADIKPANVFLTTACKVKLGDLGLGRFFSSRTNLAHSLGISLSLAFTIQLFLQIYPVQIATIHPCCSSLVFFLLLPVGTPYYMSPERIHENGEFSRFYSLFNISSFLSLPFIFHLKYKLVFWLQAITSSLISGHWGVFSMRSYCFFLVPGLSCLALIPCFQYT